MRDRGGRHWAQAEARLVVLVGLAIQLRGRGIDVVVQAETSNADGAGSLSGAVISFEVRSVWSPDEVLCDAVERGAVVEISRTLDGWPTRLRLRSQRPSPSQAVDSWGLRRIVLQSRAAAAAASGTITVLENCSASPCESSPASAERWVDSDVTYRVFDVPPLDGVAEWRLGAWGQCCCPVGDPYGLVCKPGERSRDVTCSSGNGLCARRGLKPLQIEACQDYSQCPYEPLCPLGWQHALSCDGQALLILGLVLLLVVALGLACRFCQLRWFLRLSSACRPSSRAVLPKGVDVPDLGVYALHRGLPEAPGGAGMMPSAAGAFVIGGVGGLPYMAAQEPPASLCSSRWTRTPEELDSDRELRFDSARLLGTWFYDRASRYCISKTAMGQMRFDEQITSGQWVFGVLEPHGEWLQGLVCHRDSGKAHGFVRLKYIREKDLVVSNYQAPGDAAWGQDTLAAKADPASLRKMLPQQGSFVLSTGDTASSATQPWPALVGRSSAMDTGSTRAGGDAWDHPGGGQGGQPQSPTRSLRSPFGTCGSYEEAPAPAGEGFGDAIVRVLATTFGFGSSEPARPVATAEPPSSSALSTGGSTSVGRRDPPRVLHVACPAQHAACSGEYDLVPEQRPNGAPLWKRREGGRWLYSGIDGKWYIGGPASEEKHFNCAAGYIFRDERHGGRTPDCVGGAWSRGDGAAWQADPSILVTAAPVSAGDQKALAAALAMVNDLLRVQEDDPGVYTVTHDMTAVTTGVVPAPPVLARLRAGTQVVVREIVHRPDDHRVRALIESPAGWISIRDTKDGYRWAKRVKDAAVSDMSTKESSADASGPGQTSTTGTTHDFPSLAALAAEAAVDGSDGRVAL